MHLKTVLLCTRLPHVAAVGGKEAKSDLARRHPEAWRGEPCGDFNGVFGSLPHSHGCWQSASPIEVNVDIEEAVCAHCRGREDHGGDESSDAEDCSHSPWLGGV